MLDFNYTRDPITQEEWIETSLTGKPLLTTPQLNKGTAFSLAERHAFGLIGKLPPQVESLDMQVVRAYQQYHAYQNQLKKNIYLNNLHDKNQVLFYKLASQYLAEILPIIYTPIVGAAVKEYSREFRQPRGLYISYPERAYINEMLDNRSNPSINLVVVTDGEGVLGIGDQGIGGMDIPVAKLMVYTLAGGINPVNTLPILLDVGTNNQELLEDPMYLGWRHERIRGQEYEDFIETFVCAVKNKFPHVFLHWEDFSRENAHRNLERYKNQICTFNDDMQGTGVVTLSAILAAVTATKSSLAAQRIVVFGAGTAGTGISEQIYKALLRQGISEKDARAQFWLIDRQGLLLNTMSDLTESQKLYTRSRNEVASWQLNNPNRIELADVIKNVKPTILIGCSAMPGAFSPEILQEMSQHCRSPLIMPLSNPTEKAEARPIDIIKWTQGRALLATGSPFDKVNYQGKTITIAQCNNALVFPGIGLGVIAAKAHRLTDEMLWAACETLAACSPVHHDLNAPLLPAIEHIREVARAIAISVAAQANREGVAGNQQNNYAASIDQIMWKPCYLPLKYRMPF